VRALSEARKTVDDETPLNVSTLSAGWSAIITAAANSTIIDAASMIAVAFLHRAKKEA
jgi:hypothetical protein